MTGLTRTAQVLKFFAQQHGPPGVPRKKLVKLAYMSDILARQYLGHPISEFSYIKDHYGPNDRSLPDYVRELEEAGYAEQGREFNPPFRTYRLRDLGKPVVFGFTPGESEILGYVAANYMDMDLDEFIEEVVKATDPYKAVERDGERLPMHVIDGTVRDEVGFDLEALIQAEKQAEAGEYVTLSGLADELRAKISARYPD